MDNEEVLKMLNHLIKVDIDAVHAYDHALPVITDPVIRERITRFRENHYQHALTLQEEIKSRSGETVEISKDFKGYFVEGFTALGAMTGMKGALKALKLAEEITSRYYSDAVSSDVPSGLKEILRKHFSDEKIHLDYIVNILI